VYKMVKGSSWCWRIATLSVCTCNMTIVIHRVGDFIYKCVRGSISRILACKSFTESAGFDAPLKHCLLQCFVSKLQRTRLRVAVWLNLDAAAYGTVHK